MGKKLRNTLLAGFAALYILNKGALPFMISKAFNPFPYVNNPKIQSVMGTQNYKHIYEGNNEEVSLKYLKLAHAVTLKHLSLDFLSYGTSRDKSLESRVGNCTEVSDFTLSNYLYLVKSAGKPELSKYIRSVSGELEYKNQDGGHYWLEIFQRNSWVPYETIAIDLPDEILIDPKSIDKLILTKSVLDLEYAKYSKSNIFQRNSDGEIEHNFDFKGILQNDGIINFLIKRALLSR